MWNYTINVTFQRNYASYNHVITHFVSVKAMLEPEHDPYNVAAPKRFMDNQKLQFALP